MPKPAPQPKPLNLKGTAGDDVLQGATLGDTIDGGKGHDTLVGAGGGDTLTGGAGGDIFKYLAFSDSVAATGIDLVKDFSAVAGDKFDLTALGTATLQPFYTPNVSGLQAVFSYDAGLNRTTLSYYSGSSTPAFQVYLTGNISYSSTAFLGIVVGPTELNDNLVGTPGNDTIDLLAGNDSYNGLGGDDVITGGLGSDTLNGGDGNDTFVIAGNFVSGSGVDTIAGGIGYDTIDFSGFVPSPGQGQLGVTIPNSSEAYENQLFASFSEIERVIGSAYDDAFDFSTDVSPIRIEAGRGDDYLLGGSSDDTLIGGDGNDQLSGGGGNNALVGELGDDQLIGGAGNDFLVGGGGNDIIQGRTGDTDFAVFYFDPSNVGAYTMTVDSIDPNKLLVMFNNAAVAEISQTRATITVTGVGTATYLGIDTVSSVDGLLFSTLPPDPFAVATAPGFLAVKTSDTAMSPTRSDVRIGTILADSISADGAPNGGGDSLYGLAGSDTLNGAGGADRLYGGNDDDMLSGGTGNDVIDGGAGSGDRALFSGNFADYQFINNAGVWTINHVPTAESDTVTGVEHWDFADGTYDVGSGIFTDTLAPVLTASTDIWSDTDTISFDINTNEAGTANLYINGSTTPIPVLVVAGANDWFLDGVQAGTTYNVIYTVTDAAGNVSNSITTSVMTPDLLF